MSKKGSLVIISGFLGAGKGTVVKELMRTMNVMHCPSRRLQGIRGREKKTDGNIFLRQKKSLKN